MSIVTTDDVVDVFRDVFAVLARLGAGAWAGLQRLPAWPAVEGLLQLALLAALALLVLRVVGVGAKLAGRVVAVTAVCVAVVLLARWAGVSPV